jgi:hypothetical protein
VKGHCDVVLGTCHICGINTKLTFEHVPPRAAFNDWPVVNAKFEELFKLESLDELDQVKGKISQRGAGAFTLCGKCNSDTGAWYGNAFVDWAYQGIIILDNAKMAPSLYHLFHLFPLRVLKQIICMFFSANPPSFQGVQSDLVRFVLNKQQKYLRPNVHIYTFLNSSPRSRQSSVSGLLNLESGLPPKTFSEIAFPPFGYVMCLDSLPPDPRLVDISFFANYGYNEWTDVALRLPILPVYTYLPGDYRDRNTVLLGNGT